MSKVFQEASKELLDFVKAKLPVWKEAGLTLDEADQVFDNMALDDILDQVFGFEDEDEEWDEDDDILI